MLLFVGAWASPGRGDDGLSADEIAGKIVGGRGFTWEGAKTRLRMVITAPGSAQKERVLEVLGRNNQGLVESVVRFLAPADVAGTAFLMRERERGQAEQHIYLPGLQRTRRIVGREQEGSFMGSDFTYSDLRPIDPKHAKHTRLPDEDVGGVPTYVIDSTFSSSAKSQYSKVRTWIRKADFIPLRTRFYGKDGKLQKTLYARRVRDMDGSPVVVEARMQSENGHATVLLIESLEKHENLPDSAFTPTALERKSG